MAQSPRRRRQEMINEDDRAERLVDLAQRVPRLPAAVVTSLLLVLLADRLGVRVPGRGYLRQVFADPIVFFFVRAFVVVVILVGIVIALWVGRSALAHIQGRRWIRRIAGFEPEAVHRGARELEEGTDVLRDVLAEKSDREAELLAALEYTHRRVLDLEARLRKIEEDDRDERQLELDDES